jgi:hypothetical protein
LRVLVDALLPNALPPFVDDRQCAPKVRSDFAQRFSLQLALVYPFSLSFRQWRWLSH